MGDDVITDRFGPAEEISIQQHRSRSLIPLSIFIEHLPIDNFNILYNSAGKCGAIFLVCQSNLPVLEDHNGLINSITFSKVLPRVIDLSGESLGEFDESRLLQVVEEWQVREQIFVGFQDILLLEVIG